MKIENYFDILYQLKDKTEKEINSLIQKQNKINDNLSNLILLKEKINDLEIYENNYCFDDSEEIEIRKQSINDPTDYIFSSKSLEKEMEDFRFVVVESACSGPYGKIYDKYFIVPYAVFKIGNKNHKIYSHDGCNYRHNPFQKSYNELCCFSSSEEELLKPKSINDVIVLFDEIKYFYDWFLRSFNKKLAEKFLDFILNKKQMMNLSQNIIEKDSEKIKQETLKITSDLFKIISK